MNSSGIQSVSAPRSVRQLRIGAWLIRLVYIALAISSVMDIIEGFRIKFGWVDWASLGLRLAAALIVAFFAETQLKKGEPVNATLITIIPSVIALFLMCLISPLNFAWLLGLIISLLLSLVVIQLMPPQWMGRGILISFIGGALVSVTDFFSKTTTYLMDFRDPQVILLTAMSIGLTILLFLRFSKYPVTAKLVLAITSLAIYMLDLLGIITSSILWGASSTGSDILVTFANWYLLGSQIAIILSAVISTWLARFITKPLLEIVNVAAKISKEGDLSQRSTTHYQDEVGLMSESFNQLIDSLSEMSFIAEEISNGNLTVVVNPRSDRDELGKAFLKMVTSLRKTVADVSMNATSLNNAATELSDASQQVRTATDQITESMQQMARSSQEQTDAVETTSGSVAQMAKAIEGVAKGAQEQSQSVSKATEITDQISLAIRQVAENANAVTADSYSAAEAAKKGSMTVEETLMGMQTIKNKVGIVAERITEMGERSKEIGAIVATIEDIASQTNLLALNAAIEAARAGEHGKGFAVVADEVRKLAERSSLATKEIAALIQGIQATIKDAVQAMDEGSQEVEKGVQSANQAGQALSDILEATEAVNKQLLWLPKPQPAWSRVHRNW